MRGEILVSAIQKSNDADEFMRRLLDCRGDEIEITEEIVTAAVAVEHSRSLRLIELFYERRGTRLPIKEQVLKAVAWNASYGRQLMELIFRWWGDAIKITEDTLQAAVASNDLLFLELLYIRCGDNLPVTALVFKIAVARFGAKVLPLLSNNWPRLVSKETDWIRRMQANACLQISVGAETKRLFETGLKLYPECGKKYMPLLLRLAVERNNLDLARLFLTWPGIDVNARVCSGGSSVLFEARYSKMLDLLVQAGGSTDLQNTMGHTALMPRYRLHQRVVLREVPS